MLGVGVCAVCGEIEVIVFGDGMGNKLCAECAEETGDL